MIMKYIIPTLALAALLTGCNKQESSTGGTGSGDRQAAASKDADNSALNKRDRSGDTLTPGDQAGDASDRELARNVRRAIMKNDQLSTTAKNIKIIVNGGKITLRGPVKTEEERSQILAAAQQVSGTGSIDNQLEVKQAAENAPPQ